MATSVAAAPGPTARVEAFFADQPRPRRVLLEAARGLLDEGLPGATCSLKWSYPTWSGKGNVAALVPYPEHVNLAFFQGARLPDPTRLLTGTGVGMRHVRLDSVAVLKDPAVKALVRNAWRLDQA